MVTLDTIDKYTVCNGTNRTPKYTETHRDIGIFTIRTKTCLHNIDKEICRKIDTHDEADSTNA